MMKKINIFIIIVIAFCSTYLLYCDSFPKLVVLQDKHIINLLKSEPDFNKENPLEYKDAWKKAKKGLSMVYEDMWNDFNSKGKDILPWCVYEAFNDLKSEESIKIYLSIRKLTIFPTGGSPIYGGILGEYFSGEMDEKSEYEGLWIFGLWREYFGTDPHRYCLKSVIFHEMLHYALDIAERETSDTYFKIRNIINPRKTTIVNFWSDEGVIEDCQLLLFKKCAPSPYMDCYRSWYENNARRYNTNHQDCHLCKLCKPKSSASMRVLSSNDDECDPECPEGGKGGGNGGLGKDQPDDRYSFSEGIVGEYNLAPESVIFTNGYWEEAIKLYGGLKFDGDNTPEQLLESTPFIVIPSGGLFNKEQDSTFKVILEKYVNLGGTVIVFAQQFGDHIDSVVPVPDGEELKTYGWREDQSCLKNSSYYNVMHPAMSSSTKKMIDAVN